MGAVDNANFNPAFNARKVAVMLRASRVRREFLQPLPAGITPHTVEEGAAAQRALAELGGNSDPAAACYGDIAALATLVFSAAL